MSGKIIGNDAWQVGPWILEPRGLASCGNATEAPPRHIVEKLQEPPKTCKQKPQSYVECLSECSFSNEAVTADEVKQFLELGQSGEQSWDVVSDDGLTQVHRYHDRSMCGGVFVRLSARLPEVSNLSHVAGCYVDFKDRATWDKQMTDFRVLHNVAGSDVLYSILHAPALTDRDFVFFHTICRRADGKGLLIYMRAADSTFVPPSRAVRGVLYLTSIEIFEHPEGGVGIRVLSALDPNILFLPKWIMNALCPSEWRKFVANLTQHCKELESQKVALKCASLFEPISGTESVGGSTTVSDAEPSDVVSELTPQEQPTSEMSHTYLTEEADDDAFVARATAKEAPRPSAENPRGEGREEVGCDEAFRTRAIARDAPQLDERRTLVQELELDGIEEVAPTTIGNTSATGGWFPFANLFHSCSGQCAP